VNRQFKRILGITPRQYANALRQQRLLQTLRQSQSMAIAGERAGYTSTSQMYYTRRRHHDNGHPRYRLDVTTSLGRAVILLSDQGLCFVGFADTAAEADHICRHYFPTAQLIPPPAGAERQISEICARIEQSQSSFPEIALDIRMTAFQSRVWQALQKIPSGTTRRYQEIAVAIGQPTAARAVAQACAQNPVAVIIPCHRAVHGDNRQQGYRWGIQRKQQLIARETHQPTLNHEGEAQCQQSPS
jgi:AraC family transcriptional regulator of adaptative response/methylated-DNA-[protein]-cysteine methyltransferase